MNAALQTDVAGKIRSVGKLSRVLHTLAWHVIPCQGALNFHVTTTLLVRAIAKLCGIRNPPVNVAWWGCVAVCIAC